MNETIINGIDVSECEHHYTNPVNEIIYHGCAIYEQINELGYSQDTLCEQNPDCYFKQLKRLQEENKSLQMLSCANCGEKYLSPEGSELYDKNVQLQKENEELKARFNELYNNAEQLANKYNKYNGNKENELVEIINKTTNKRNKYKQALEEIRNILCYGRTFYDGYFDNPNLSRADKAIKVISEVLK